MATYFFNRENEARRHMLLEDRSSTPTLKAAPTFPVRADDGTVIRIPYEFLGDTANIVVTTRYASGQSGNGIGYDVLVDNHKSDKVYKTIKNFFEKQAAQQSVKQSLKYLLPRVAGAAGTPIAVIFGLLWSSDAGNDAISDPHAGTAGNGKPVRIFLTGANLK